MSAVNSGDISLDDYDITNEAKETIQGLADSIDNNVSDDDSSPLQLAQLEAQGFWHWLGHGLDQIGQAAGAAIPACMATGLCEALLLIATPNPELAIPGVV